MSDLLAARLEMAIALAFHIVFAVIGVAMPLMMVIAEVLYLRTKDEVYLALTKRWAKGTAIFFAVGAVSGTVLSFTLGLLWPKFMGFAGGVIGLPFALEGFAFFTEAIFLGIYLYGWDRVPPVWHVFAGVVVALSGVLSAAFVVLANSWMNAPSGFREEAGRLVTDSPIAAMISPAAFHEVLHSTLATYAAAGMGVAGLHAYALIKDRENLFHRKALTISLVVGGVASLLVPVSGHVSAQRIAKLQPAKLAACEAQFETRKNAPLRIGGWPDREKREVRFAIELPGMLSFLAFDDFDAEVKGLDAFPKEDQPDPLVVHLAFQVMVGTGSWLMAVVGAVVLWRLRGKRPWDSTWLLRVLALSAPLGFLAVEAGWTVTEVGRQPWIIYGVLRTKDAVTPVSGIVTEMALSSVLYAGLTFVVVVLLRYQIKTAPRMYATKVAP